jgi:hypothetical protein
MKIGFNLKSQDKEMFEKYLFFLSNIKQIRNLSNLNHFEGVAAGGNRGLNKTQALWVFDDIVNKFFKNFQLNEYPVDCFALNFGEWGSEESVDRYAINCHGHLHLLN